MRRIVMCPPHFFDVTEECNTNRWMSLSDKPNRGLAMRQWVNLVRKYKKQNLEIGFLDPEPGMSDMTFVANAGLPLRIKGQRHFILSNFYHKQRMGELSAISKYFESNFEIWELKPDEIFEGQADTIWIDGKTLLIVYGVRTNIKGVEAVSRIIRFLDPKIKVSAIAHRPLGAYLPHEKPFYHSDLSVKWLKKEKTFLIYPRAFLADSVNFLRRYGQIIYVSKETAESFLLNSPVVGNTIIASEFNDSIIHEMFIDFGYDIDMIDLSEFKKSGGGGNCLTLFLD